MRFVFYPSKLKKQPFCANNFKIQWGPWPPFRHPWLYLCTRRSSTFSKLNGCFCWNLPCLSLPIWNHHYVFCAAITITKTRFCWRFIGYNCKRQTRFKAHCGLKIPHCFREVSSGLVSVREAALQPQFALANWRVWAESRGRIICWKKQSDGKSRCAW